MAGASETTGWHRRPDEHARRPCAEFPEVDSSAAVNWYTTFVELPLTVSIPILIVPLLALTVILVMAVDRGDYHLRDNDNVATTAMRLIGGAFIFMSAFVTVALWQESSRLADTVGQEFGHASVIVNQLSAQEVPRSEEIIGHLRTYASLVMDGELINPRVSSSNDGANEQVFEATRGIVKLDAAGTIESDDAKLLFDSLGGMTLARNSRLSQPYPPYHCRSSPSSSFSGLHDHPRGDVPDGSGSQAQVDSSALAL